MLGPSGPELRENCPDQAESRSESGFWFLLLLDPVLVDSQLALGRQQSCRHPGSRGEKCQEKRSDVNQNLTDEEKTATKIRKDILNSTHDRRILIREHLIKNA